MSWMTRSWEPQLAQLSILKDESNVLAVASDDWFDRSGWASVNTADEQLWNN